MYSRQVGDEQRLAYAATDADVGLDDVHGCPAQQVIRLSTVLHDLAASQGNVEPCRQPLIANVSLVLRHWLLEPGETELAECLPHVDRRTECVSGVAVGHQVDL